MTIESEKFNIRKSYWNHKGKHQKVYESLYDKLVLNSGKANTPHGELLRCISKLYCDYYNNGGGNICDGALKHHVENLRNWSYMFTPSNIVHIDALCQGEIEGGELELLIDSAIEIVKAIDDDGGFVNIPNTSTEVTTVPVTRVHRMEVMSNGRYAPSSDKIIAIPTEIWDKGFLTPNGRYIAESQANMLGIKPGFYTGPYKSDGGASPMMSTQGVKAWAEEGEKNGVFLVPCPVPYVPYQGHDHALDDHSKARFVNKAAALWKALDMLGISGEEAYKQDYSLNDQTWDDLNLIAMRAGNHEASKFIQQNKGV